MKTAIITGATGQDGAYLSELLLSKGYRVVATHRRSSSSDFWRLQYLGILNADNLRLLEFEIDDVCSAIRLIERFEPQEIYNLAAQTYVASSFDHPVTTCRINGLGALNLLEAIRTVNRKIRFYQASSAEMFGKVQAVPQCETTPFYPRSPYGVSKLFAHWMTVNYREAYDLFACSGILFNHESPLRGRQFVTRRISEAAARISTGDMHPCRLGNLNARRDWGYAKDYVDGMWRMLQADASDSYVLATGRTETVRDFVTMAFKAATIDINWVGEGPDERAYSTYSDGPVVVVDPTLYRPAEVDHLIGDSRKALQHLGWHSGTTLEDLCALMVEADIRRVETADLIPTDAHLAPSVARFPFPIVMPALA